MVRAASPAPQWHPAFLAMLPAIRRYAQLAFRACDPESREELVAEVVANALVAFVRLVELDKADLAYPSVLARFAIGQTVDGRRVGSRMNGCDISSPYAQKRQGIELHRLDHFDRHEQAWEELVVEDRRWGPADVVRTKLDFAAWLGTLSGRLRQVVRLLIGGERATVIARRYGITDGRVSQLRKQLYRDWLSFQDELPADCAPATA